MVKTMQLNIKRSKKAYMKTLEAVIAFILTFLFITTVIETRSETEKYQPDVNLMDIMKYNPEFRNCALSKNISCLNATLERDYPDFAKLYGYKFNITNNPKSAPPDLPEKNVHLESLFISGNETYLNPIVVRLYYWFK
ncbi:MAG: hypothetical protein N3D84_00200 [Candidatus Woesearchaeota archaeon]|nr:hypothetical protein [Candidatus Woesearchaeota archaeon]